MAPSQQARKNHDELFPGHVSTLAVPYVGTALGDQQHVQRYLSSNGFGGHLTRTGIDVPTRELLTFSMLVSLGGCEPRERTTHGIHRMHAITTTVVTGTTGAKIACSL